jgi:hypothetical protein
MACGHGFRTSELIDVRLHEILLANSYSAGGLSRRLVGVVVGRSGVLAGAGAPKAYWRSAFD